MSMEYDNRRKDTGREGPSPSSMNDSGGDKPKTPELSEATLPKADIAAEREKTREVPRSTGELAKENNELWVKKK